MNDKPTYEELEQRVRELEKNAVRGTEKIKVSGINVEWTTNHGTCTFENLPVAMMWIDTTLAGLMSGVQAMVGTKRFGLALQSEGRKSVEEDWRVISRYADFRDGFKAIANIAAVAGWGEWELVSLKPDKQQCTFRIKNSWEGLYQKALRVNWGSGMLAGKMAGYTSKLFKTNCWAEQKKFIAEGDVFDEFLVQPSERTIEKEIDNLLATDEVTKADMAVALKKLQEEISERRQAELALRSSEKRYRLLADSVRDVIWTRDMDLNLTYISPSVFEQQGFTVEEALARPIDEAWTPDSLKRNMEVLKEELEIEKRTQKDMNRSRTIEVEVNCKDGSTIWTEAKMSFLRDSNDELAGIIGITRDITRRKQVEESLRQSEERYRSLVENTIYGFFIHEIPSGRFLFSNQRACELFGYTTQEALQLTIWDVLSFEDHERIEKRVRERAEGNNLGPDIQTYTGIRKDNSTFRLEVSSSLIMFQDKPAVQGIIRDVTEQERLERQLRKAQKMEAMGTLAGGIAHDFNNLLMGIQGRTSLMLMNSDSSHSYFEHLKGIEDYVKSATDLTKQLLGFASGGKYEVKVFDLNEIIKNQNRMFGRTTKEVNIQEKFEEDLWTVEIDQGQIEQVILNIYVNAWQAMPGGGNLFIQTNNIFIDESYTMPYQVEPGNYVKISITDTGVGMDEMTRQRIFDPFFTTKEMGRGTGLGLASAYGIIKNHKGFINVYSEKGKGTTFNIYLPASEKEVVKEKEIDEKLIGGKELVLLVDDEDMIIEVGQEIMEKLGYKVLTSKSGKEAIEIYEKNRDRIDMVILDMIMPGMGGSETYDRLKEINPGVKVLLSSGYSINGQATDILKRGCNGFIQKPFNMAELSKKIREILFV